MVSSFGGGGRSGGSGALRGVCGVRGGTVGGGHTLARGRGRSVTLLRTSCESSGLGTSRSFGGGCGTLIRGSRGRCLSIVGGCVSSGGSLRRLSLLSRTGI